MVQKIVWTPKAEIDFEAIVKYLEVSFGQASVYDFTIRLNKKLNLIAANPSLYTAASRNKKIHKAVVNKRLIIFYRHKP